MPQDYVWLARVMVDPDRVTGKTRHYREGGVLPPPHSLRIVQLPPNSGYYLLYLDSNGEEMTDTWHDSVAHAKEQAEYEFGLRPGEWESSKA